MLENPKKTEEIIEMFINDENNDESSEEEFDVSKMSEFYICESYCILFYKPGEDYSIFSQQYLNEKKLLDPNCTKILRNIENFKDNVTPDQSCRAPSICPDIPECDFKFLFCPEFF